MVATFDVKSESFDSTALNGKQDPFLAEQERKKKRAEIEKALEEKKNAFDALLEGLDISTSEEAFEFKPLDASRRYTITKQSKTVENSAWLSCETDLKVLIDFASSIIDDNSQVDQEKLAELKGKVKEFSNKHSAFETETASQLATIEKIETKANQLVLKEEALKEYNEAQKNLNDFDAANAESASFTAIAPEELAAAQEKIKQSNVETAQANTAEAEAQKVANFYRAFNPDISDERIQALVESGAKFQEVNGKPAIVFEDNDLGRVTIDHGDQVVTHIADADVAAQHPFNTALAERHVFAALDKGHDTIMVKERNADIVRVMKATAETYNLRFVDVYGTLDAEARAAQEAATPAPTPEVAEEPSSVNTDNEVAVEAAAGTNVEDLEVVGEEVVEVPAPAEEEAIENTETNLEQEIVVEEAPAPEEVVAEASTPAEEVIEATVNTDVKEEEVIVAPELKAFAEAIGVKDEKPFTVEWNFEKVETEAPTAETEASVEEEVYEEGPVVVNLSVENTSAEPKEEAVEEKQPESSAVKTLNDKYAKEKVAEVVEETRTLNDALRDGDIKPVEKTEEPVAAVGEVKEESKAKQETPKPEQKVEVKVKKNPFKGVFNSTTTSIKGIKNNIQSSAKGVVASWKAFQEKQKKKTALNNERKQKLAEQQAIEKQKIAEEKAIEKAEQEKAKLQKKKEEQKKKEKAKANKTNGKETKGTKGKTKKNIANGQPTNGKGRNGKNGIPVKKQKTNGKSFFTGILGGGKKSEQGLDAVQKAVVKVYTDKFNKLDDYLYNQRKKANALKGRIKAVNELKSNLHIPVLKSKAVSTIDMTGVTGVTKVNQIKKEAPKENILDHSIKKWGTKELYKDVILAMDESIKNQKDMQKAADAVLQKRGIDLTDEEFFVFFGQDLPKQGANSRQRNNQTGEEFYSTKDTILAYAHKKHLQRRMKAEAKGDLEAFDQKRREALTGNSMGRLIPSSELDMSLAHPERYRVFDTNWHDIAKERDEIRDDVKMEKRTEPLSGSVKSNIDEMATKLFDKNGNPTNYLKKPRKKKVLEKTV